MTSRLLPFGSVNKEMASDLCFLSIAKAASLLKSKKLSPIEITSAFLDRIDEVDSQLNSFILVTREAAFQQAKVAEAGIMAGRYRGPFHGIPIGLKDLIETAGIPTTAHSKVLLGYVPKEDATVVHLISPA